MTMASSSRRRLGVAACSSLLVFCLYSNLPRTDVFLTAVPPLPRLLSSSSPAVYGAAGWLPVHFLVASAAPTAGAAAATEESRSDRLLKYAEQRAENAEEELRRFRETHETSVRACSEASQRKDRELVKCQEQTESFRQMYNSLQVTKTALEKEVHSLQSQLAIAKAAAAAKGASADGGDETAKLRAAMTKLEEKLQDMEDQHAIEISSLQQKVRELLTQRELLRQGKTGGEGDEGIGSDRTRHIASISAIKTLFTDVARVYRVLGEQMLTLVPPTWWERFASMKMDVEVMTAPYTNAVYERVFVPLTPYVEGGKTLFFSHVYPLCEAAGRRAAGAAKTLSDDVLPAVNARLDAALQPIFAKHPDVEVLVPSSLGDRLAAFVFVLLLTYLVALFSFRCLLFPIARLVLPVGGLCRRRRTTGSNKRTRTGGPATAASGAQQKRFIPSGAAASGAGGSSTCNYPQGGGGAGKKGQQAHHNPSRLGGQYEGAHVNVKKA